MKKILQVCLMTIVAFFTFSGSVAAQTQVIHVEGEFATQQPIPSPLCEGLEDCVVDDLTGDLVGTNRLITLDFIETPNRIIYEDETQIITQYGTFNGTERGIIDINTGEFRSVSQTSGVCGSRMTLVNEGFIDLETLEDFGTYQGVLRLKEC